VTPLNDRLLQSSLCVLELVPHCWLLYQRVSAHQEAMHTLRAAEHEAPSSIIGSANECTNRYRCQAAGLQLHTGNKKYEVQFSKLQQGSQNLSLTFTLLKPCTVGAQLVRVVAALQLSFLLLAAHI
jgi:hypothetical protein